MNIYNMQSSNGNPVPNQFLIEHEGKKVFKSYSTIIAENDGGLINIDPKWKFSATTTKYLCQFIGGGARKRDIEQGIENGTYQIKNLNN